MKSKINIIIYILYSLILLILSFNYQYVNNVNLAISNNFDNFNLVYSILKYTEIIIFYIGYGSIYCTNSRIGFRRGSK